MCACVWLPCLLQPLSHTKCCSGRPWQGKGRIDIPVQPSSQQSNCNHCAFWHIMWNLFVSVIGPACVAALDDKTDSLLISVRLSPGCFISHICSFRWSMTTIARSLITLQHSNKICFNLATLRENGGRVCIFIFFFYSTYLWEQIVWKDVDRFDWSSSSTMFRHICHSH